MDPLWTAKQAAAYLNVQPTTIYAWVKAEYIPHLRLGTGQKRPCIRFRASELRVWLDEKAKQGRSQRIPERFLMD